MCPSMRMPTNISRVIALFTLATVVSLTGCVDYDEPGEDRVRGNRGYACLFHEDCAAPLQCFQIQGEAGNVCSGPQDLGAPCQQSTDCQFKRNELGLPLFCEANLCAFPAPADPSAQP